MNVLRAAHQTVELARHSGMDRLFFENPETSFRHLVYMLETMKMVPMSYGKMCRWLGWIQACVVAADVGLDLEDMKRIGQACAGPAPVDEAQNAIWQALDDMGREGHCVAPITKTILKDAFRNCWPHEEDGELPSALLEKTDDE